MALDSLGGASDIVGGETGRRSSSAHVAVCDSLFGGKRKDPLLKQLIASKGERSMVVSFDALTT